MFHPLNYCVPGRHVLFETQFVSSSADSAPLSHCLIFWQLLGTFCEPQQTYNLKRTENQVQMLFIEILSLVSYKRIQHFSASRSAKKPKTWINAEFWCVFHKGIGVVGQPHSKLHLNLMVSRCWLMSHCVFPPSLHVFVMEVNPSLQPTDKFSAWVKKKRKGVFSLCW